MVIDHVSCFRAAEYMVVFTVEARDENRGYQYIQQWGEEVQHKALPSQKRWLFEHMGTASFIKSFPLE